MSSILEVKNLKVLVEDKPILDGIEMKISVREIHALMGKNGSGKSTLAQTLAGRPEFQISEGQIFYKNSDLTKLSPQARAQQGLFVGFQHPIDLPGVRIMSFLQAAVNARRKGLGLEPLNPADFIRKAREKAESINIGLDMLKRETNVGFSGGERKKFEALQMLLLEPDLAILDEIDSGLDMEALQLVARAIQSLIEHGGSVLLITHYPRLLEIISPDHVHILQEGRIAYSGNQHLVGEIERSGYSLQHRQVVS